MGTNITGIGNANAIGFKSRVTGGIYFPPELKDALVGVWSAYGKSNDSTDRNIIKNKIKDRGGDFVISNAAFKLNSGFGGFVEDFTSWDRIDSSTAEISNDGSKIKCINTTLNVQYLFNSINRDIPSFKVKISNFTKGDITYYYRKEDGIEAFFKITPLSVVNSDKVIELPKSYNTVENGTGSRGGFYSSNINIGVTIEQIPSFEGAFVTDGIDDLITSTKTVQEMLGGSNEITVVSMTHKLSLDNNWTNLIGELKGDYTFVANRGINTDKTGIYGYTYNYNENAIVINNILGDKNDYIVRTSTSLGLDNKYYVTGFRSAGIIQNISQIAWYWTFIANRVLTTDEINQVIAYYNLDRTLNPDILYNTIKQGITNENHAEFGDKLIDFSGNGRDIQLNNIAWDGDSGIGKYNYPNWKVNVTQGNKYNRIVYYDSINGTYSADFKGITDLYKSYGLSVEIRVNRANTIDFHSIKKDGIYTITPSDDTTSMDICFGGENVYNASCDITITQIPSHAGALCLDGVNDFGKVTGMPVYKDYTVVTDREIFANIGIILSKNNPGAFVETAGNSVYSFGQATSGLKFISTRSISYLSKYSYCGQSIAAGAAEDVPDMWLGTIRDGDSRFFNGAIYSLMSFPYSMSEFLIERQLKKHKLGTLYPDMVEFRPVIKSNVLLDAKPTFVIRGTSTYLNAGDYVPENSQIWVSIKMNNIADRITKFTVNGKTIDIPENAYSEVTLQYGFPFVIDKSPQKISITIEQDENYVLFNPVINSNYDNYKLTFHLREYEKLINIGDYIPKGTYIRANLYLKNDIDELVTFTFNGVNIDYAKSPVLDTAYNIRQIYNYDSPQEVNITIDEYIRYEDIVQPYPVLLRFNDENGNEVSWGGKFKVGSTITRIGSIADPERNLLNGLYSISGLSLNGKTVTSSTSIVEKQMVFRTTATWLLDDNEPKVILSPSRLRIPNSSYKILGYIPDISGHGNHGKINNSVYAGASGANGYLQNFSGWTKASGVSSTDSVISSSNNLVAANGWIAYVTSGTVVPTFKVEISGIPINGNLRFEGSGQTLVNGVNTIQRLTTTKISGFYISSGYDNDWSNLRIEQVGEYEGAYCLDGVDDFVTIPTVTGGKQVLMKVNWQSDVGAVTLYDQRLDISDYEFAIYNGTRDLDDNPVMAYQGRNNGQTYIDGILNTNIMTSELKAITHNITITNELSLGINNTYPVIGSTRSNTHFAQMSLYDFMLFDEISTDDKIKELNEYVGIEGNTE